MLAVRLRPSGKTETHDAPGSHAVDGSVVRGGCHALHPACSTAGEGGSGVPRPRHALGHSSDP